ncbi:MAG TPA: rhamnogalacturonan acetylesterase [Tepidisphaeraceae bacterium]|nr:rhamnogalacturonan acetylesterase [Tepidisphaeraceae bacterium]
MTFKPLFALLMGLSIIGCATSHRESAAEPKASETKPFAPLKLAIIGDSTVANYPLNIPDRGWGQFIGEYFDKTVTVVNLARNGRSTKTFINEGLWQKALDEKPNFVLIQFGHNDSHAPTNREATNAATDFRDYLRQYIDQSRAIGAKPILVTPVQRRTYGPDGKLNNSLLPYANAMKEVAAEKKVPVIDLNASSGVLYEKLGAKANEMVSRNGTDATHFNERGARWMADLVMSDLLKLQPELRPRTIRPVGQ